MPGEAFPDTPKRSAMSDDALREVHEELHALGNCLAQIKIGNRLIGQTGDDASRRIELVNQVNEAVADAESVFRLLSAQLR